MVGLVVVSALLLLLEPGALMAAQRPILRFSRQAPDDLCHGALNLKTFLFMNNICEDCFRLYRDPDVYSMCRYRIQPSFSHCIFGSKAGRFRRFRMYYNSLNFV